MDKMDKYAKFNEVYAKHKAVCGDGFHNALWQIMINDSCVGAFTRLLGGKTIAVALEDGGYVPALFEVPEDEAGDAVLEDLNLTVFKLDKHKALATVGLSVFAGNLKRMRGARE